SFFFQAEDGIRDRTVTGVQTCALPILLSQRAPSRVDVALTPHVPLADLSALRRIAIELPPVDLPRVTLPLPAVRVSDGTGGATRSEERRVGKEGRWRGAGEQ